MLKLHLQQISFADHISVALLYEHSLEIKSQVVFHQIILCLTVTNSFKRKQWQDFKLQVSVRETLIVHSF